jgi:hypothetical protein
MQVIQITRLTGHSPYNITICDVTYTYCYTGATGVTTVPLIVNIPTELLGATELLVVVTDSIGCQDIQYHFCGEPSPTITPTNTLTPTPTPTPTPTTTQTPTPTDTGSYLLQGDNFFLLQGDGSKIIIL